MIHECDKSKEEYIPDEPVAVDLRLYWSEPDIGG